jgi:hypothetical protein
MARRLILLTCPFDNFYFFVHDESCQATFWRHFKRCMFATLLVCNIAGLQRCWFVSFGCAGSAMQCDSVLAD